jgi:hypothetical protein
LAAGSFAMASLGSDRRVGMCVPTSAVVAVQCALACGERVGYRCAPFCALPPVGGEFSFVCSGCGREAAWCQRVDEAEGLATIVEVDESSAGGLDTQVVRVANRGKRSERQRRRQALRRARRRAVGKRRRRRGGTRRGGRKVRLAKSQIRVRNHDEYIWSVGMTWRVSLPFSGLAPVYFSRDVSQVNATLSFVSRTLPYLFDALTAMGNGDVVTADLVVGRLCGVRRPAVGLYDVRLCGVLLAAHMQVMMLSLPVEVQQAVMALVASG